MKLIARILFAGVFSASVWAGEPAPIQSAVTGFDVAMRVHAMRVAFSLERSEAVRKGCAGNAQFVAAESGVEYIKLHYPGLSSCDKLKLVIALSCIYSDETKRDHLLDLRELFRNDAGALRGRFKPTKIRSDRAVARAFRSSPAVAEDLFSLFTN